MVKQPEVTEKEDDVLDDAVVNTNGNQDTVIVKDVDVRPNDHKVLEVLSDDRSSYTFRGLMRKLGIHQESLSRALHRLDELGLVEKSYKGYRLSKKGAFVTKSSRAGAAYVPLLQTYIPSNINIDDIVGALVGRWFKNLRWLGMVEGEREHMLQWVSENGSYQLNLRIVGHYIIIETNAEDEKVKVESMVSAYKIFEQVSRLYRSNYGNVLSYTFMENPAN